MSPSSITIVGAPISLLIHETLDSSTIRPGTTFIVRPVGGSALVGSCFFSYNDVLTFQPAQPLATDTTYEVVVPAGGIRDAVGNGIEPYSFRRKQHFLDLFEIAVWAWSCQRAAFTQVRHGLFLWSSGL